MWYYDYIDIIFNKMLLIIIISIMICCICLICYFSIKSYKNNNKQHNTFIKCSGGNPSITIYNCDFDILEFEPYVTLEPIKDGLFELVETHKGNKIYNAHYVGENSKVTPGLIRVLQKRKLNSLTFNKHLEIISLRSYIFRKRDCNLISAENMFKDCINLKIFEIGSDVDDNIQNMNSMFENCELLTYLNLQQLKMLNVKTMDNMFKGCEQLKIIEFPQCFTGEGVSMNNIFKGCKCLSEIGCSNELFDHFLNNNILSDKWGYDKINNICINTSLNKRIKLNNFGLYKPLVINGKLSYMCVLTSLSMNIRITSDYFNELNGYNIYSLYFGTQITHFSKIISINLTSDIVKNFEIITTAKMFENRKYLKNITFGDFNTKNVTDMSFMFYNCQALTEIDLSKFDFSKTISISGLFAGCKSLIKIIFDNNLTSFKAAIDTSIEKIKPIFENCNSLSKIRCSKELIEYFTEKCGLEGNWSYSDKENLYIKS